MVPSRVKELDVIVQLRIGERVSRKGGARILLNKLDNETLIFDTCFRAKLN